MNTTRHVDLIVIHCAATPNGRWTTTLDIDAWHRTAGFRRTTSAPGARGFNPQLGHIGYHWVLYTNGARATGRHVSEVGAHTAGHNGRSIGLCLVGTDAFSADQWAALADQVDYLCIKYRIARQLATAANGWKGICGHRDTGAKKLCPGFSVADWLAGGMQPLAGHVLPPPALPAAPVLA